MNSARTRILLEGCGVGILMTMPYIWPEFSPYHSVVFHSQGPINSIAWGALIDLLAASAIGVLVLSYIAKRNEPYQSLFWALLAARLGSILVQSLPLVTGHLNPGNLKPLRVSCAALAEAFLLQRLCLPTYRAMARVLAKLLALAGLSMAWMFPELLYQGFVHFPAITTPVVHGPVNVSTTETPDSRRRIVWLLFDELSYYQTFERRPPGLAMPAFDSLRSESVLFTNVEPAGYHTEHVVPALLTGESVQDSRSDLKGNLLVKIAGQKGWHQFDAQETLFAEAKHSGWTTGLVGWYNPYCRILPGVLDFCYWRAENDMEDGVSSQNSALENALAPLTSKISFLKHRTEDSEPSHTQNEIAVMEQAQQLIQDKNIRFLFIHLPVPHPPGIYDRTTGQLRDTGTYIDNLALADRSLNNLLTTLRATNSWDRTTLIVCSDHSWRVPIWRSAAGWSAEEEAASQGKFDPRPMLMIRFPGQSNEVEVAQHFPGIELHDLLEQMLRGNLESTPELESWIEKTGGKSRTSIATIKGLTDSPHSAH